MSESKSITVSTIPCARCGGPCVEFTVPNDVWNYVVRFDGKERADEYMCEACYRRAVEVWVDSRDNKAQGELLAIHEAVMNPQDVVINTGDVFAKGDTFTLQMVKEFIIAALNRPITDLGTPTYCDCCDSEMPPGCKGAYSDKSGCLWASKEFSIWKSVCIDPTRCRSEKRCIDNCEAKP